MSANAQIRQFVIQELMRKRALQDRMTANEQLIRSRGQQDQQSQLNQVVLGLAEKGEFDRDLFGDMAIPPQLERQANAISKAVRKRKTEQRIAEKGSETELATRGDTIGRDELLRIFRTDAANAQLLGQDPAEQAKQAQTRVAQRRLDPGLFARDEALRTRVPEGSAQSFINSQTGQVTSIPDRGDFAAVKALTDAGFVPFNASTQSTSSDQLFGKRTSQESAAALVDQAGTTLDLSSLLKDVQQLRGKVSGVRLAGAQAVGGFLGAFNEELGNLGAQAFSDVPIQKLQEVQNNLNRLTVQAIPIVVGEQSLARVTDRERELAGEITRATKTFTSPEQLLGTIKQFLTLSALSQERLQVKANRPLAPLRAVLDENGRFQAAPGATEQQVVQDINKHLDRLTDLGFSRKEAGEVVKDLIRQRAELRRFDFIDDQGKSFRRPVRTSTGAPAIFSAGPNGG